MQRHIHPSQNDQERIRKHCCGIITKFQLRATKRKRAISFDCRGRRKVGERESGTVGMEQQDPRVLTNFKILVPAFERSIKHVVA